MYFYNMDTGTLHIEGYCAQSTYHPYHIKVFNTEKEARDFAGEKILCVRTAKKKESKK